MRRRCDRLDGDCAPTGIAGHCGPRKNTVVCDPLDTGFTPTRWFRWQDGPMAYRFGPTSCADSHQADAGHAEAIPVPAPAAEVVPPPTGDEVPKRPVKPAPRSE